MLIYTSLTPKVYYSFKYNYCGEENKFLIKWNKKMLYLTKMLI